MKLVLANMCETSWRSLSNPGPQCLIFEVEDLDSRANRDQYANSNDGEEKAIVQEILRDSGKVPVYILVPKSGDGKWSVVSGYVFEKLHKRFPEHSNAMGLSVYLSCSFHYQALDFISLKGRKCGDDYMCTGTVNFETFQDVINKRITTVYLKLIIDISDKSDLAIKKLDQSNDSQVARKVLEEELFSDVTISAECGGVKIKTHKCFLSASSPVLKRMFENEMKESKTGIVEMDDASERGVRAFLRYLYYGDMEQPKEDTEVAFELLSAAHKYDVPNLETEMVKCLLAKANENFTARLAFRIYMFVRNIENGLELKKKTIQIMKVELDELEAFQEYKDLFEKPSNSKIAMELCRDLVKTV